VLLPMVMSFQFGSGFFSSPWVVGLFVVTVSFLMVSRVPTFSFKRFRVPAIWVLPLMIVVGLLAAFLVTEPWATLGVIGLIYLGGIPFSMRSYRVLQARAAAHGGQPPEEDVVIDEDEDAPETR
jgi:CDP-diacylglycerol--serine O-phosphatidyltransferase